MEVSEEGGRVAAPPLRPPPGRRLAGWAGLRELVSHSHFKAELHRLGPAVADDVPALLAAVEAELARSGEDVRRADRPPSGSGAPRRTNARRPRRAARPRACRGAGLRAARRAPASERSAPRARNGRDRHLPRVAPPRRVRPLPTPDDRARSLAAPGTPPPHPRPPARRLRPMQGRAACLLPTHGVNAPGTHAGLPGPRRPAERCLLSNRLASEPACKRPNVSPNHTCPTRAALQSANPTTEKCRQY
jgi:hypothetical protein